MAVEQGKTECYPIAILPGLSKLFLDFADRREALAPFYAASAYSTDWMAPQPVLAPAQRETLCDLLEQQNRSLAASDAVFENIARLRGGAGAVVTGQQVTLFGGPLFTILKAATAIRKAKDASVAGTPHVPIFWLATEDHDLAEADHVTFPNRHELSKLSLGSTSVNTAAVGSLTLGNSIEGLLEQAAEILGPGPFLDQLVACYRPGQTLGQAFGRLISSVFAAHGLIVVDAAARGFHTLGRDVLRQAVVRADELRVALTDRDQQLAAAGYHSQVLVSPSSSLLFLFDNESGARVPLRRATDGSWQAARQHYSTQELLAVLDETPERLSPNALLRPIFQDSILPTAAYIGGPAEVAYFAQSQVLYDRILGRTTPVLPRLSATLIEPAIAALLARHEVSLPDVIQSALKDPLELSQRLGARSISVVGKRKLAAAGNALDTELSALATYMHSLDPGLGRAADVSSSKMRYQMNRMRRLAANYELRQNQSLSRDAGLIALNLFPDRHPQERILGAAWFLSRYDDLSHLLVEQAGQQCPGHKALWL
ncbi:MAG TPA: bacillithiol biosynthesis cysteine-adding enzyme BshC [Acidobacteriaceae bacterium]|nr:bacillithiol biosynthesis cysteine-adding enzyme BshC [Acidobacteriaceae bacterium]